MIPSARSGPHLAFSLLAIVLGWLLTAPLFASSIVVEDATLPPTYTGETTAVLSLRLTVSEPMQLFDAKTRYAVGIRLSNHPLRTAAEIQSTRKEPLTPRPFEESITLPAHQTITLDASQAHLHLIGLAQPLRVNQAIPVTLHFLDSKSRTQVLRVMARVRYQAPSENPPTAASEASKQAETSDLSLLTARGDQLSFAPLNASPTPNELSQPTDPRDELLLTARGDALALTPISINEQFESWRVTPTLQPSIISPLRLPHVRARSDSLLTVFPFELPANSVSLDPPQTQTKNKPFINSPSFAPQSKLDLIKKVPLKPVQIKPRKAPQKKQRRLV